MRTKLEIAVGVILLVVSVLYAREMYLKAISTAVAVEHAKIDQLADEKADAKLKKYTDADQARHVAEDKRQADRDQAYAATLKSVQHMTSQQLTDKLPTAVPDAKAPVKIMTAESAAVKAGEAKAGDAIVPQEDIKPVALKLIEGQKCQQDFTDFKVKTAADNASCTGKLETWKEKYDTKTDEAKQWETAARGGSVWKRIGITVLKVGGGALGGAAAVCATGHCK